MVFQLYNDIVPKVQPLCCRARAADIHSFLLQPQRHVLGAQYQIPPLKCKPLERPLPPPTAGGRLFRHRQASRHALFGQYDVYSNSLGMLTLPAAAAGARDPRLPSISSG